MDDNSADLSRKSPGAFGMMARKESTIRRLKLPLIDKATSVPPTLVSGTVPAQTTFTNLTSSSQCTLVQFDASSFTEPALLTDCENSSADNAPDTDEQPLEGRR